MALHRGRGSCTRSSGPLDTIVVRSYKVSDVAQSVHAIVPGNRAAIALATTRFLHTCTMIPLEICSSQAVEKGQISGGVDSQFVLTWHELCETERPRLAADLAQPRGPDGEVRGPSVFETTDRAKLNAYSYTVFDKLDAMKESKTLACSD